MLNVGRRHLNESQRAMAAAKLANLANGQRKTASPIGEAVLRCPFARFANFAAATVERAREVTDHGAPGRGWGHIWGHCRIL